MESRKLSLKQAVTACDLKRSLARWSNPNLNLTVKERTLTAPAASGPSHLIREELHRDGLLHRLEGALIILLVPEAAAELVVGQGGEEAIPVGVCV